MPCLFLDDKNTVHVVRHDNESIEFDVWKMIGNFYAGRTQDFTDRTEPYGAILNPAKNAVLAERAQRDEIRSGLRIVKTLETYCPANGAVGSIKHIGVLLYLNLYRVAYWHPQGKTSAEDGHGMPCPYGIQIGTCGVLRRAIRCTDERIYSF